MTEFKPFSVLISVYAKDNAQFLHVALDSVFLKQTLKPNEIVIVQDGPVTVEIDIVLNNYLIHYPQVFKIVKLSRNKGLGEALNYGLAFCNFEYVARMDADDICYPDRFEKQFTYLLKNTSLSVLGSAIQEFNVNPNDIGIFRKLPHKNDQILEFAKFRNPLNHPSVVFKKSDIISVGSFMSMPLFEDYYLWVRVLGKGLIIENLPEPLLHFRVGNDMIGRRHGSRYLKKEINFLKAIKKLGFINLREYLISLVVKSPLRLIPKSLLKVVYKKFLR
jgi:glycosyltransferase involved in cell wall biosynthesis